MKRAIVGGLCAVLALLWASTARAAGTDNLERGFANPPPEARLRAYWWWLNGNVTKEAITRDLEEMAAKGFGGAIICDAGGAEQDGNARVPHGPTFFSPEWRELYKHTLREADRLGLEMSLNIQSGWNLGGPMVKAEDAAKKLVWSETRTVTPGPFAQTLPEPTHKDPYYRDLFVVAYPAKDNLPTTAHRPIRNAAEKAMLKALSSSAPDTSPLLTDFPATPGEEDTRAADVIDLTSKLEAGGALRWEAPPGNWVILRFGCTVGDHSQVSTSSDGWKGYALDVLDAGAFKRYWDAVVEPLIADAGPLAGHALKYLHTDSWEVEAINWTPTLREEFRARRGYDLLPYLPTIGGRIVQGREETNRFLFDFRKTLGDLAVDHHYKPFAEWSHAHGLLIHPESGGPHAVPIDAQRCLGMDDAPMSEFWARSWRHRVKDEERFFIKQPASAAHTSGKKLVMAEGFTTIGPHWQETLWDNLKPSFDRACCEGLNRLVWHAFVCSPKEMGIPGQQYFAGTHLNPNVTWWEKSAPFFTYLNRCQFMLQRGLPVADVAYYYGDGVPNFAQLRASDPAKLGSGYDYDVVTEEAILTRMSVRDGRIVLPDGMNYAALMLPLGRPAISLPVLRKIKELVEAGATLIGDKPQMATGLTQFPANDAEVRKIADQLWGDSKRSASTGKGRVVSKATGRETLSHLSFAQDCDFSADAVGDKPAALDYIHRRDGDTDIYFISNRTDKNVSAVCRFRVADGAAELWDPITGKRWREFPPPVRLAGGRGTTKQLTLEPYGSIFVVFRKPDATHSVAEPINYLGWTVRQEINGPWQTTFDPQWGGPGKAIFERLESWTKRPEDGIRFYSGTATYRQTFELPLELVGKRLALDLGGVREIAEVRLNGRPLGIVWAPPFRVELADAAKPGNNELEIEVTNFWPNRIIGDAALPPERRLTQTNIRRLTKDTPLVESGLLGPVRLMEFGEEVSH